MRLNLSTIQSLAEIASGTGNISNLEKAFLAFSSANPQGNLTLSTPKLYEIKGIEIEHVRKILEAAKVQFEVPNSIGISGDFHLSLDNLLIFLSSSQRECGHADLRRSSLHPLLEKIYVEGLSLIKDFTIQEGIFGEVIYKRGIDKLDQLVGLNSIENGHYTLEVELDTPEKTVQKFESFSRELVQAEKNPKATILDSKKVSRLEAAALNLREKLGVLSKYSPPIRKFSTEVPALIRYGKNGMQFWLYNSDRDQNALVYFGDNPFATGIPRNLTVLSGEDSETTLRRLLEMGFYRPSLKIIEQRINDLTQLIEFGKRTLGSRIVQDNPQLVQVRDQLIGIKELFGSVKNDEMRIKRLTEGKYPYSVIDLISCPTNVNPVYDQLLPLLSWSKTVRGYHSPSFRKEFVSKSEEGRQTMLSELKAHLLFQNQQNPDTNRWLYTNYRSDCEKSGIVFS